MRKGQRVWVLFKDISASLHSEGKIEPAVAELCGWVSRQTKKDVEITYCRYKDGCDLKDGIVIPKDWILKSEVI